MAARRDTQKGWIVDFVYAHADGRKDRVRKTSPVQTKRGAEEYERQLRRDLLHPQHDQGKEDIVRIRFRDFASEFTSTYLIERKYSTRVTYESSIRVHLEPAFGALWLDEIGAKQIAGLRAKMLAGERSKKTVKNTIGVLSKILHVAKTWGHLAVVPAIPFERLPDAGFRFLSDEEIHRVVGSAGAYWYAPIFTALQAGLRQGELWALRREQVDLQRGVLRIDRAVWRGVVGTPKHDKIREVDMPPSLLALMREQLRVVPLSSRLVFPKEEGGMRLERKADTGLRRACQRAGIAPCGWHVLRHTYASRLVMAGVPLLAVKELLGHSDIRTTMRYAHLAPGFKAEAVKVLDRAFEPTRESHGT